MKRNIRTKLVRGIAAMAAAWVIRHTLIGFRRGVADFVAAQAAENERAARGTTREPLNLYGTAENALAHLNVAYGVIVRDAKQTGAINADHPETLPDSVVSHVRIMRRKPGTDGPFVWDSPGEDFQA